MKWKYSAFGEEKSNLNCHNRELHSYNQFPDPRQFTKPESLERRGSWAYLRKELATQLKFYTINLPLAILKGTCSLLPN